MEDLKRFFLRIGSVAEKQYIEKTAGLFSGVIARANLFEAAPGMMSGTLLRLSAAKRSTPYIIDPANDASVRSWQVVHKDRAEAKLRKDLKLSPESRIDPGWMREIESPREHQSEKVEVYGVIRAYRKLADKFFADDIAMVAGHRRIDPDDFQEPKLLELFVSNVLTYQKGAISFYYDAREYDDFKDGIPEPQLLISPYFMISDTKWLDFMQRIWHAFDEQCPTDRSGTIVQCRIDFLKNNYRRLLDSILGTKMSSVFLWLDGFDEEQSSKDDLGTFVGFVADLASSGKRVINLYAGGLSILLFPFGLTGIVNNPGYGMDRQFEPVKGGPPTAQYYIPSRHTRHPVGDAYDRISKRGQSSSKEDFYQRICGCPICRDGIQNGARDMIMYFGELGPTRIGKDGVKRRFASPAALERCRYHFLLSRLMEFRWAREATKADVIRKLELDIKEWEEDASHLTVWRDVLREHLH
jgi:hypothetical protein